MVDSLSVLPRTLANGLRHVPLPKWVADCCGLRVPATVADLGSTTAPYDDSANAALEFFIGKLIATHAGDLAGVTVYPKNGWLSADALAGAAWPTRVANALHRAGLWEEPQRLASITYGQLLAIEGMGLRSAIAFALQVQRMTQDQVGSEGLAPPSNDATEGDRESLAEALRTLMGREWADEISGSDPRFAVFLPSKGDSVTSAADSFLQALESADDTQPQLPIHTSDTNTIGKWVAGLEARVNELEQMPLESFLEDYLATAGRLKGTRLQALLARLGWTGRPAVTLQEAGDLLGVTRERIRQIESKVLLRLPKQPVFAPAVSRALRTLGDMAPIELQAAERLLQEQGISTTPFSIESLIAAASTLSIDCPIRIASARGVSLVVRRADTPHLAEILRVARRKAGASGVVSAHEVAARVSASHVDLSDLLGQPSEVPVAKASKCTAEEVDTVLSASPGFRALSGSWYWATDLPSGRNRLVNLCRSMLSVTAPISVARIRDGVKREYTFRNLSGPKQFDLRVPPADVLRTFLRDYPDFVVDDNDMVRPTKPIDYRQELGVSDQILVEVLRSNPSAVLDRATILRECLDRGVNVQTLGISLTYSCLVEHVDTNIWCLRGADVHPAAVEALRKANALRPREKRVRDFGWTPEGKLWIATVVPASTQTFVFGAPAGTRPFLAGQKFGAFSHDGVPYGTLGVTQDGSVYGLSTFQSQSGCDPGDILVLEFDLAESRATLVLGDEELLDRYAPE